MHGFQTPRVFKKSSIAMHTHEMKAFLEGRGQKVDLTDDEHDGLVYFLGGDAISDLMLKYGNIYKGLQAAGMMSFAPVAENAGFLYFTEDPYTEAATVTEGFIRLPKTEHLITLSAEDFYKFFQILANAKNSSGGTLLALDLAAGDLTTLFASRLGQFFLKKAINYRMNPAFVSRRWTPRAAIKYVAGLPEGRDCQMLGLQYLACFLEESITHFPLESAIELELEFKQIGNSDYCVPPRGEV